MFKLQGGVPCDYPESAYTPEPSKGGMETEKLQNAASEDQMYETLDERQITDEV